jgi:nicotinate-nucleotide adenylyltransferase
MAGLNSGVQRIGVFGGSFDPPHIAHLILADEACHQLSLNQVLWILTPNPPHKEGWELTPVEQRLEMLEAAIYGNPCFYASRVDVSRPPPYYAVDTMGLLRETYPNAILFYLMGADSLRDLPTWERPQEFIEHCDGLGVMGRPGVEVELARLRSMLPQVVDKVKVIESPLIAISAREIRNRIKVGLPFRYFVPESIYNYIQSNQLYVR